MFRACYVAAVSDAPDESDEYPGARLGLPRSGPGAVAGWGRRLLALFLDFLMCRLVVSVFIGSEAFVAQEGQTLSALDLFSPFLVYILEATILTALLGGSAGQLICKVQVRRVDGRLLDIGRALLRSALVCLVIPPVVYNRDLRGLHDLAVDSVAVRR
jgi:hypothetical protein